MKMKKLISILFLGLICASLMAQRTIVKPKIPGNPIWSVTRGDTKTDTIDFELNNVSGAPAVICWSLTGTQTAITATHKATVTWYRSNRKGLSSYQLIASSKDSIQLPTTRKVATGTLTNYAWKDLRAVVTNSDSATLVLDVFIAK